MKWQTAHGVLEPTQRPLVMGILNVTPDSFSDGGRYASLGAAVAHARQLVHEGADLIDVGGESTRPGAAPVPVAEERRRVVPVVEALRADGITVPVSVDTRHADTAAAALDAGADVVNDVSALADPEMGPLVAARGVPVVLMHMQGDPATMQQAPRYDDVVSEVWAELQTARDRAEEHGIVRGHIMLDPGLGFGKRTGGGTEDNGALLSGLPRLLDLGCPLLVGASRKRFIETLDGRPSEPDERLGGSITAAVAAAWAGAAMVRVHDVRETVQALQVAAALDPESWQTRWHPPVRRQTP